MSKLEDNVNDILGIEKKEEKFSLTEFEQPAPVPRKIDETLDATYNREAGLRAGRRVIANVKMKKSMEHYEVDTLLDHLNKCSTGETNHSRMFAKSVVNEINNFIDEINNFIEDITSLLCYKYDSFLQS